MLLLSSSPLHAESLISARRLAAQTVIGPDDIIRSQTDYPGALRDPANAIGQELRVNMYPDQPLFAADLKDPALIERNATVTLEYRSGGLSIRAEGRALGRAAAGEPLKVMNLQSKAILTGQVGNGGQVLIGIAP